MGKSFIDRTQNTILSAAFVLAVSTGLNAILGLVKNRLLASKFGVSQDLAIFYTADKIPGLIYSILVIGAISTIFIPVFTSELKKNRQKAFETASSIINMAFLFILVVSVALIAFSKHIIFYLSVGKFTPAEVALGAQIMNVMLVSQMVLVAGSLETSILQSFKLFFWPALAPIFYNVGMLLGIVFLSDAWGIMGPTLGTLVGATLHFLVQFAAVRRTGYRHTFLFNSQDKGLLEIFRLVPPRILSVAITNIMATLNNSLAIIISTASVVYLKFGSQLQNFPVVLFGASIAAASLPTLSEETNKERFKHTFLTSLHQMNYLVIPLSVMMLVLRIPIVRLVYGVDRFPWEATLQTSYVLAFYSLSIFSQSAIYLITRAFYALKDTYTPVKVSLITVFFNLAISLWCVLFLKWQVWAVALSFSITSFLDMCAMLYFLGKKLGGFSAEQLLIPFIKTSYAAMAMGLTLYIPLKFLDVRYIDTSKTVNLILLTGIASACGVLTYLLFTKIFRVYEIQLFYKLIRRLNLKPVPVEIVEIKEHL